jgi:hypothetical protein
VHVTGLLGQLIGLFEVMPTCVQVAVNVKRAIPGRKADPKLILQSRSGIRP